MAQAVQFIRVELDVNKGWLTITKEGRYPYLFFHERFITSDKLMKRGKKREREDNSSTMAGIFYYQGPKERASIFSAWVGKIIQKTRQRFTTTATSFHVYTRV